MTKWRPKRPFLINTEPWSHIFPSGKMAVFKDGNGKCPAASLNWAVFKDGNGKCPAASLNWAVFKDGNGKCPAASLNWGVFKDGRRDSRDKPENDDMKIFVKFRKFLLYFNNYLLYLQQQTKTIQP